MYGIEEQIENLGLTIVLAHVNTFFGSVILACCLWFGLSNAEDALWAGFVGLVLFYAIGMAFVVSCKSSSSRIHFDIQHTRPFDLNVVSIQAFQMKQKMEANPGRWTWTSMTYELMFKNIADLRSDLSGVVGYLPFAWTLLIKFFIPPVILILFGLACDAENADGTKVFGHYSGYVFSPYQILGILCVVFAGFLFLSSLVAPNLYSALQRPEAEKLKKSSSVHVEPVKPDKNSGETSQTEEPELAQVDIGESAHTETA